VSVTVANEGCNQVGNERAIGILLLGRVNTGYEIPRRVDLGTSRVRNTRRFSTPSVTSERPSQMLKPQEARQIFTDAMLLYLIPHADDLRL